MPYFDHNATTPLTPAAREAWLRVNDEVWANPSSLYRDAARARLRLEAARDSVARCLEGDADRIVFTSGATEAANAIFAHLQATLPTTARIAVNPTEHPCVLAAAGRWFPGRIEWLPVDAAGVVTPAALEASRVMVAARAGRHAEAGAVVVMAANNETGVLQPWRELAAMAARVGLPFVCDASQWLGKLAAAGLGAAGWVFGAGHKFGAPRGTGFIHLPPQAEAFAMQVGGAQQRGHRAGTEDVAGAAALAAALVEAEQRWVMLESDRLRVRDQFEAAARAAWPGVTVVGSAAERLWNTVTLILPFGDNTRAVTRLDARGFQVSTGSACAAGKEAPSHVLAALGLPPEAARRVIRVSAGWSTTPADWDALVEALRATAKDLAPDPRSAVITP